MSKRTVKIFFFLLFFFTFFTLLGVLRVWYSMRLIEKEYKLNQSLNDFEKLYNENLHLQLIISKNKNYFKIKNFLKKYGFVEKNSERIISVENCNE